jgi:hypothetical protein
MTESKKELGALDLTSDDLVETMRADFLLSVGKTEDVPVSEVAKELSSKYLKALTGRIDYGKKTFPGNFFVEVVTRIVPLLHRTLRRTHVARLSCPTPKPGHEVWKYVKKDDRYYLLWSLPVKKSCEVIYRNRFNLLNDPSLKNILDYYDGTLLHRAKVENNEPLDDKENYRIVFD